MKIKMVESPFYVEPEPVPGSAELFSLLLNASLPPDSLYALSISVRGSGVEATTTGNQSLEISEFWSRKSCFCVCFFYQRFLKNQRSL